MRASIFLGQVPQLAPSVPTTVPTASRLALISRQEAEMLVRIVESVVDFMKDFPLEFYAYCPPDRWKPVLEIAGNGVAELERQLATNAQQLRISADVIFAISDLEECIAGARDARLDSAKVAMFISAGAAIAETLFGLTWVGLPAYITSLAIVLGRPVIERTKEVPSEPFRIGAGAL